MLQALQLVINVHKHCLHIVIAQVFTQQQSQLRVHNGCKRYLFIQLMSVIFYNQSSVIFAC